MYNVLESAKIGIFLHNFLNYDKSIIRQCQFYCCTSTSCAVIDFCSRLNFLNGIKESKHFSLQYLIREADKPELIKLLNKHNILLADTVNNWKNIAWRKFIASITA
jgi:hypothetical protein